MSRRVVPLSRGVRLSILVACAALLSVLSAPGAEAYWFGGQRWPNKVITVSSEASRYNRAVAKATRVWNGARVGVHFQLASSRRARLLIRYGRGTSKGYTGCEGVNGAAVLGYPGPGYLASVVSVRRSCRSERLRIATAVHELGHVLGLGHEDRRCSIMNSRVSLRTAVPALCRGAAARSDRPQVPVGRRRTWGTSPVSPASLRSRSAGGALQPGRRHTDSRPRCGGRVPGGLAQSQALVSVALRRRSEWAVQLGLRAR